MTCLRLYFGFFGCLLVLSSYICTLVLDQDHSQLYCNILGIMQGVLRVSVG